jgi:hypothetical protein
MAAILNQPGAVGEWSLDKCGKKLTMSASVNFDRVCGLFPPFDVRFAPKATHAGARLRALCLAGSL